MSSFLVTNVTKGNEEMMWVNPGIHLFVSGVDQEHVGWVQDFLL